MGVAGCGKSSLGHAVAQALGWPLVEGDDFHPAANVAKMRAGIPLVDADRVGWLALLGAELQRHPGGAVLTCSALKRAYRDQLRAASRNATRPVADAFSTWVTGRPVSPSSFIAFTPSIDANWM